VTAKEALSVALPSSRTVAMLHLRLSEGPLVGFAVEAIAHLHRGPSCRRRLGTTLGTNVTGLKPI
jgi:hypothetical protein